MSFGPGWSKCSPTQFKYVDKCFGQLKVTLSGEKKVVLLNMCGCSCEDVGIGWAVTKSSLEELINQLTNIKDNCFNEAK